MKGVRRFTTPTHHQVMSDRCQMRTVIQRTRKFNDDFQKALVQSFTNNPPSPIFQFGPVEQDVLRCLHELINQHGLSTFSSVADLLARSSKRDRE